MFLSTVKGRTRAVDFYDGRDAYSGRMSTSSDIESIGPVIPEA